MKRLFLGALVAFAWGYWHVTIPKTTTSLKTAYLDTWQYQDRKDYRIWEIKSPVNQKWKIRNRRLKQK